MPTLSDVEWIFVVLVILYVLETLVWVRSGATLFISRWGSFRNRDPATRLTGNEHGSLFISGLSPADLSLICHELPVSVSVDGVVAFVPSTPVGNDRPLRSGDVFAWSELTDCHADQLCVIAGGRVVCQMSGPRVASRFANKLASIAAMDEDERTEPIKMLYSEMVETRELGELLDNLRSYTPMIRRLSILLLLWMVPVGLLLYHDQLPGKTDGQTTIAFLVVLFGLWWLSVGFVWRAHRKLYRDDRMGRFQLVACSILSPAVPLRAIDYLGRELLAGRLHHPLAISAVVDTPERFRALAEQAVKDLAYPLCPEFPENEHAMAIVKQSRELIRQSLSQVLANPDFSVEDALMPPIAEDEESACYCPRCGQQFEIADAVCDFCGGRPTHAFVVGSTGCASSKTRLVS